MRRLAGLTRSETKLSPATVNVCPSSDVLVLEIEEQLLTHAQAYLPAAFHEVQDLVFAMETA